MSSIFTVLNRVRRREIIQSADFNNLQDQIQASFASLGEAVPSGAPLGSKGVGTPFHVGDPQNPQDAIPLKELTAIEQTFGDTRQLITDAQSQADGLILQTQNTLGEIATQAQGFASDAQTASSQAQGVLGAVSLIRDNVTLAGNTISQLSTQVQQDISNFELFVASSTNNLVVDYNNLINVPTSFTPSAHSAGLITSGVLPAARGGTGRSDARAPALVTARTITTSLSGDVTGSASISFDGATNRTFSIATNINRRTTSTPNSVAARDGAGDISARLFRSEFDATNASIGFIMTQINTGTNNFIRPSTPAQFRAAVTDGFYSTQVTFNNSGNRTIVRQAQNTYVNRFNTGNATYTLDESTFLAGDKVYISKLFDRVGTLTITTDQGQIFLPNGAGAAAQTLDVVGTIVLEKIDTVNWIARSGQ